MHLLTAPERAQLQDLARAEGAGSAALWLRQKLALDPVDARNQLAALRPPVELAVDDPELRRTIEQAAKRSVLGTPLALLAAGLVGLWLCDARTFVVLWWPVCVLALVARWLARPSPYGHPRLIMIGIVLIPVSGVAAVAMQRTGEPIPILGLPLLMLCLVCMAFGMAETLFAQRVPPGAPRPEQVVARRVGRRLARVVLACYLLVPLLALNLLIADLGRIDDEAFNALFRYALFLIVAAPVTALFCAPLAQSVGNAVVALAMPLLTAAWLVRSTPEATPLTLLADAAVVQLLAVYLTVIGGLLALALSRDGRRTLARSAGLYLLLAVGLLLGNGALQLLGSVLLDAYPGRGLSEWAWWTLLPAALVALAVVRRGDILVPPQR
jgi:hypothetical protein